MRTGFLVLCMLLAVTGCSPAKHEAQPSDAAKHGEAAKTAEAAKPANVPEPAATEAPNTFQLSHEAAIRVSAEIVATAALNGGTLDVQWPLSNALYFTFGPTDEDPQVGLGHPSIFLSERMTDMELTRSLVPVLARRVANTVVNGHDYAKSGDAHDKEALLLFCMLDARHGGRTVSDCFANDGRKNHARSAATDAYDEAFACAQQIVVTNQTGISRFAKYAGRKVTADEEGIVPLFLSRIDKGQSPMFSETARVLAEQRILVPNNGKGSVCRGIVPKEDEGETVPTADGTTATERARTRHSAAVALLTGAALLYGESPAHRFTAEAATTAFRAIPVSGNKDVVQEFLYYAFYENATLPMNAPSERKDTTSVATHIAHGLTAFGAENAFDSRDVEDMQWCTDTMASLVGSEATSDRRIDDLCIQVKQYRMTIDREFDTRLQKRVRATNACVQGLERNNPNIVRDIETFMEAFERDHEKRMDEYRVEVPLSALAGVLRPFRITYPTPSEKTGIPTWCSDPYAAR